MKKRLDARVGPLREDDIWLAGYFDATGNVFINNHARKSGFLKIAMRVTITGHLRLMKMIHQRYPSSYMNQSKGRKYVELSGHFSKQLLEAVAPWVIQKADHVELALEFIKTIGKSGGPHDEVAYAKRQELLEKLHKVKKGDPGWPGRMPRSAQPLKTN